MKKLWLSAIAAACLLAGNAAHAGDHHGGRDHGDWNRGHDHSDYRHNDGDDRSRHWDRPRGWHDEGRAYYRPVFYARPVYYSPRPVYYEHDSYRDYRSYDDDLHGSISVNF
ncbi:MAG TPA: hypothetical protein VGK97_00235 [Spongiibacteraceae bacterium]